MMRTANPALNERTFSDFRTAAAPAEAMTIQGTVNKTAFLLVVLVLAASWVWRKFLAAVEAGGMEAGMNAAIPWMIGGLIGGLVFGLITVFKKEWARGTAPFYAALEGMFLGGLSAMMEAQFPGIVLQAVGLTFGTLFALLAVYKSGLIKVTNNFRLGVAAATGGVMLVYLVSWILGMFGMSMPLLHSSGWMGIGFSLVIIVIAALNLVLDFDFIENAAERGAPKYVEWYAAFGLLVTLVWLYIEILRLLSKLRSR